MTVAQDGGDIAIVGMGCRFPGDAKSPKEFFEMLLKGRSGWSEVPDDRFNVDAYWHPSYERHGTIVSRGGHFLQEDIGLFDAPFFSMTQAEASAMDPQHRMLLEITYESLENAGIPLGKVVGSDMACFVGGFTREYEKVTSGDLDDTLLYTTTGNGLTMMSNRVSWFYDLRGPSLSLDTACSSSLVALHLACQTIRSATSKNRQALVAGVNVILIPDQMTTMNPLHFLSPDSHCYSFDDRANGYARGEGVGVLVLKHIDDAIRDNDCIRAVIRGTGVNQDGKTPGITLPSSEAQISLIRSTYESAGLDFADTAYFEAHGTGTAAGDPLEMSAIGAVFDRSTKRSSPPLYVGSVKPNIGHLEAGAGLAGMIKTVLTLEAGVIPPNINFRNPNPRLRLDELNFVVPTQPTPWPTRGLRRASVNSFGYGGTNGHCILDDAFHYLSARGLFGRTHTVDVAPQNSPDSDSTDSGLGLMSGDDEVDSDYFSKNKVSAQQKVFVLSAPEQSALLRLAQTYSAFLEDLISSKMSHADEILEEMAVTLGSHRSVFQWRTAIVAGNAKELAVQLLKSAKPARASKPPSIVFCFNGQGAQWHAMGRELLVHEVYGQSVATADQYFKSIGATWSVLDELCASEDTTKINKPQFSQPLCAVLQIALVDLLRHWNLIPTVVVGHSSGEIGAAYSLGSLSAEQCWKIAFHRGRLASELQVIAPHLDGSMMAVGLAEHQLEPYIKKLALSETDVLSIACINSPTNVTISGDSKALKKLEAFLKVDRIFCRMLTVENAYHSDHMHHIADDYLKSIEDIKPTKSVAGITMISSVTGRPVLAEDLGPSYWVDNMVSPVQFVSAIESAFQTAKSERRRRGSPSVDTIVEIGPHSALQGPIKQILAKLQKLEDTTYLSALRRGQSAVDTALRLAGELWSKGANVSLGHVNSMQRTPKVHIPLIDLPKYPWNHVNRYWHESPLSKSHRFRHAPRTDLLGAPVKEFTMLEPTWKNIVRLSELPWINDHKVRGNVVFPAAGMICAALEGARQIADKQRTVESFDFRDITIGRALIIPGSDPGVEVFTRFNPRRNGMRAGMSPWYEFTFVSLEPSQNKERYYVEHASGLVSINYRSESSEMGEKLENEAEAQIIKERYLATQKNCTMNISMEDHYEAATRMGFDYGPSFQGMTGAKVGIGEGCFTITIKDTKSIMPAQFEFEHLLHPTTLDSAIQTASQAIEHERGIVTQLMVPTGFESLRVSVDMPKEAHTELIGYSTALNTGYRDNLATIMISTPSWEKTMLEIHNLSFTGLGDNTDQMIDDDQAVAVRKICSKNQWKADVDLLDPQKGEPQRLCGQGVETPHALTALGVASTKAAAIFIRRALKSLTAQTEQNLPPHLKLYVKWIRDRHNAAKARELDYQNESGGDWLDMSLEAEERFFATYVETHPADGKLVCAVGQNLSAILNGTAQPLPIMLEGDMLTEIYASGTALKSGLQMFRQWFELKGHKQPDMKVLEIGAGTGSITLPILEVLGGTGGRTPRFGSYCFTDISTGWFEKARELFKDWQGRLDFKKLDIEEDPIAQGFEPESFDVIAASNVLHATKKLAVTLANCHRLLKPGGKLVIGELTDSSDLIGLVFGTLPGWWLSDDGREGGPLITQEEWHRRLQLANFTGLDVAVAAIDTCDVAQLSMMVSTKPSTVNALPQLQKLLIVKLASPCEVGDTLASALCRCFSNSEVKVEITNLETASSLAAQGELSKPGLSVVSLLECDEPVFARCSKDVFEAIRNVILNSPKLFWVTCSASSDGTRNAESCAISGLFRCAKSENPRLRLHELHLQKRPVSESEDAANIIARVLQAVYATKDEDIYEDEVVEVDGMLNIPRLVDDEHLNRTLQTLEMTPQPEPQPLVQANRPLKLTIGKPGLLDSLHFVDDNALATGLLNDHVEVEVRATALNSNDVLVALGQISDLVLGIDVAGTVARVGSNVKHLKVGDRVAFPKPGGMCTVTRVRGDLPQLLPDNMSFEDGATIPLVFMAAYQSLIETAHLSRGERVLIHSAAGGLGQAMIQIAKHLSTEIFVTVSSTEKRDLMMGYGIPEDHVFSSRNLGFAKGIKRVTGGKGVDVVINTLAGEAMRETWGCISPFGRFVELGKKDILANNALEMKHFLSNVSFASVNIQHICLNAPAKAAALLEKVFNLFRLGVTKVVHPVIVFDYSDVEQAFRKMQHGTHAGKLVLKATEQSMVPAFPRDAHPLELDPNATYVLVGGLGGLGRGLAIYLADHGAKHLAFFSRTDEVRPEAQKVLEQLWARSVQTAVYACDITDAVVLKSTMARIAIEMPLIKGVIQGAMVLRDGLYETMPYENWVQATRPKIEGSWNLHELMPKDLEFFVMLSSVAGILGNRGQSNYCAGNTYQDALAYYRRSQGLTAQTVDLGAIGGLGWFEENREDLAITKTIENLIINSKEFFCILKSAMTGYSRGKNRTPTQLVTGAGSGGLNKANLAAGAVKEYYWLNEAARMAYLRQLDLHSTLQAEEGDETGELKGSLTAVTTLAQATDIIQGALAAKLAKSMMIASDEIDVNRPVSSYGVDSLVAAEMRNWCFRELKADINVFELLSGTPIVQLAGQIAERSSLVPEGVKSTESV